MNKSSDGRKQTLICSSQLQYTRLDMDITKTTIKNGLPGATDADCEAALYIFCQQQYSLGEGEGCMVRCFITVTLETYQA